MLVLGRPTAQVGDAVEIQDVPGGALPGVTKLRSVRHMFNGRDGYLTELEVTAQGSAGGGLAGAGAAAAGAIGGLL